MAKDWNGMTVNERLFVAGIQEEYYRLYEAGDLDALNRLLAAVKLRIDENGMHWSLPDGDGDSANA